MRPKLAAIVAAVEQEYGLEPRALYERTRRPTVAHARQLAMWLARETTTMSLPEIGIHFHQMHHTTVLFAVRSIERRMVSDGDLFQSANRILTTYGWKGIDSPRQLR